jgi:phenylpropionate dioxygenase-like ring-hydroxylating dioxygenase large terminal subunit
MPNETGRTAQREHSGPSIASTTYLRNTWYVAMWGEDLPAGEPRARTILNEPLVFFRKEGGGVAALSDLCPHRFAPLSAGKVLPGDRIMCPYHGLEFGTDGSCVHNPHGNGTIPSAARVRSYPVVEKHSLLWIWMGQGAAEPTSIPDYSCFDTTSPVHVTKRDYLRMEANYEIITDNLLDLSHTSYLHEGILGNAETVGAAVTVDQEGDSITVRRSATEAALPGLFKPMVRPGMERALKWNAIRWSVPGCMHIDTGVCEVGAEPRSGTGFYGIHLLTPETDRSTHYHFAAVRWNPVPRSEAEDEMIREHLSRVRRFAFQEQDAPVIEAQQRAIDRSPVPLRPVMLSVDAGPARYRRILERLIHAEREANSATAE